MRVRAAVFPLAALVALSAAWPFALSAQPGVLSPARREVRIGVPAVPVALDPGTALEGGGPLIARQVFDTLVAYREGSTDIEPALATGWSASRDGLVWSFTLRDNVRFHDGTALTAAEVVASFERHLKAGPVATVWGALLRGVPGVVREVRAADTRTVQVLLVQPYAPLLTALAHPGLGIARLTTAPDGGVRLVGTGPWRPAETVGGRLVLEAVPGHWTGVPRADRLVFAEVATEEQAEAALDGGTIDIWFPPGPPRRTVGALSTPGLRVGYLAFQTEREPFSRKPIRHAIAAALDPAVIGAALGRAAIPLQSFLPPGVWARREGSPILGGSRQAVAALLKEGQWPPGYTATLLAPSDSAPVNAAALAEALQLNLEAAEIQVRVQLEPEAAVAVARAAGEHDMVLVEAAVAGGDPHLFLYPLSTSEGAARGAQIRNFSFYRNPRVDDVLIRASQIAYRPERYRLYQRAQALLAQEVPWLPLYVRLEWAVVRPGVRGLRLHPTGFHRLGAVSVETPPATEGMGWTPP